MAGSSQNLAGCPLPGHKAIPDVEELGIGGPGISSLAPDDRRLLQKLASPGHQPGFFCQQVQHQIQVEVSCTGSLGVQSAMPSLHVVVGPYASVEAGPAGRLPNCLLDPCLAYVDAEAALPFCCSLPFQLCQTAVYLLPRKVWERQELSAIAVESWVGLVGLLHP